MTSLFEGKLVKLRAIEPQDAEMLFKERQDDELSRLDARIQWPRSLAELRSNLENRDKKTKSENRDLLIETLDGRLVGGVSVQLADPRSGTFSIGIGLSERSDWGKGYAKETMILIMRYMFHERRYQKCNIGVYAYNEHALGFYRHLGFVDEGCLRRNHFTDGEFYDEILLGMTREEYDLEYPEMHISLGQDNKKVLAPADLV